MNADGSVVIQFDSDISDVEKKISKLKTEIQNLKTEISEKEFKHDVLVEQAEAMRMSIEKAKVSLGQLRSEYAKNPNENTEEAYNRAVDSLRKMNEQYNEMIAKADKLASSIEQDKLSLEAAKRAGGELQSQVNTETGQAATSAETSIERLKSVLLSLKSTTKDAARGIGELAKSGFQKLVSAIRKASGAFLSLFKSSKKANGSFSSSLKMLLKYGLGVRSFYFLFRKIRTAIGEGFKNLAPYSDDTNKSISMVMSSLTRLKNSIASALDPILNVVAPILANFINLLSEAATYAGMFIAAISGQKTFAKAISVQEDYAESLKNTSNSAKAASKSLASFDEINKLSGESSTDSETRVSDMFETVEIEPLSFESWGQAFSSVLDSVLNDGIPKIKAGLTTFASWLNTFSANLYEMFTFPGVYEKVVLLGSELANALNGLVNQIDRSPLGSSLGSGLNTALGLLLSFVYTFDWLNFGSSIANLLNNAVAEIDWNNVGAWLWSKFKIAIETLAGFLLNLDMAQLAQAAGNIVIGFFDSMTETIQNIDWFALGEQVKEFLVNVDWAGVAESVFTAIGSAFGAAASFLWGLIKEAWGYVVNWWHDTAYEDGKFTIEGLLNGIWDAMKSIATWIKEHIFNPFVNGFKNLFGIHSPSTVMSEMGRFLMDGLISGVTSKISSVISTFNSLKTKIQEVFSHISDWFRDKFSAAWKAVKDVFSSGGKVFDGIKDGILSGLKAVINTLISGINKVITIPFEGINTALKKIKDVNILGLKPFSWINTISIPQIPYLAQGAVLPANKPFLAMVGDQPHGTNVEAPLATIQEAVATVMEDYSMANLAGHEATVEVLREILQAVLGIEIGDDIIGRANERYQQKMNTARGGA